MPTNCAKFSSEYLPTEEVLAALLALPGVFRELLGTHKIVAMYGWAANIHTSLQWQPMDDATDRLECVIENSIEQRIVIPGASDFIFEVPENRLCVTFCHESDIHLNGSDEGLLQCFMAAAPFRQMLWHTKEEFREME